MQRLLPFSLVCVGSMFYAMEKPQQSVQAIRIKNILTPIPISEAGSPSFAELGALLRYPSEAFKKTDVVIIDRIIPKDRTIPQDPTITKQGTLDSLTCDNVNAIATGFACYHPFTKKGSVGTIAIDRNIISSKKDDDYLAMERNAIFVSAVLS